MKQVAFGRTLVLRLLLAVAIVTLASLQIAGTAPPISAQGTATIEVSNIDAGTGLPAPFTRFQVTSENGTVYGPLETDLNGYVAFSVTVDPQGTSFTVEEETPPACATAPEPQTTDPLAAGDSVSLSFTTQDNPGCGLGAIALYAMACPDGFSGPADDYGPWRDGCTGTNDGTGFTLTSAATGESWNPTAGEYGIPGRAPVVGLPAGDYTFQQNDDTTSTVFCLIYDTANYATSPEPSSVEPVTLSDGVGTIALSGDRVSCDVFTVPGGAVAPAEPSEGAGVVEPATGASLEVHLSSCPPGYVPGDAIYDDCHGNGIDGRQITLYTTAGGAFVGNPFTVVESTPGPGIVRFDGLPDGSYTLTPWTLVGATVVAYCTDGNDSQFPVTSYTNSKSFFFDLSSGDAITCDLYEIPAAQATSYLEMHALACPAGSDPNGDLYNECHGNGVADVTFVANGPNGFLDQQTTTVPSTPGPGIATFGNLLGGSYTIDQQDVDPTTTLVAYCSLADADDVVPFDYVDADTITLDLPADTGVVCDWYAIPAADAATTLQVTKYSCPVGMEADENTSLATFQQACADLTDGVDFTLAPLGQQGATLTTGTSGAGTVLFEGLPTGSFSLTEDIPGEFNTPWAFCGLEGGDLQPYTWIRGGDPLAIDAGAGTYICQWFNIPADMGAPSSITVTKYLCPEGTASNYSARCGASPLAGATFLLDGPGTFESDAVTDADGTAWFGELGEGAYTLTEIPPSGTNVAVYVVSCEAGDQDFETTYNDRNGMRIELDLPSSTDVTCNWYNMPPSTQTVTPSEGQGSITVLKFLCQGKSVNAYNWEADCVAETGAIGFSLKTAAGRPIAVGTTNGSGTLKFTNLANGAYSLDETSGDWCHAEGDRVDSGGNVLVSNGGNTDVYIYNCSLNQVGTLPSTGTGVQSAASGAGFDGDKLWQLLLAAIATLGIALVMRRRLQQAVVRSAQPADDPALLIRGDEPAP